MWPPGTSIAFLVYYAFVCFPAVLSRLFLFNYRGDVDAVHDLMDEVAEQQEIANEISDAISNPVGFGNEVDEVCSCHLEESTLCFSLPRTKK